MRKAAARKLIHTHHPIRRPRNDSKTNIVKLKTRANHLYRNSMTSIRRNPYKTLGLAVGLSALSGILIWFKSRE